MTIEAPPLERKLAAILAADVEGYSRLMHVDEERTLATLTTHRKIVDDLITAGRGQISGTAGDGLLAEFASVIDAFYCAIAIQQALAVANADLPDEAKMLFRIGINVGDVMVKDDGIFGDGVNIAARVEALAEPGGICVTRGVRDHLRDRMDTEFEDLGEHGVKNIPRSVRVFRVLFDPLGKSDPARSPSRSSRPRYRRQPPTETPPKWHSGSRSRRAMTSGNIGYTSTVFRTARSPRSLGQG